MSKKKKDARRAALKGFASKGKFQSPVHSNGFKQDMLIDLYGGDKGFELGYGHPSSSQRAEEAIAAGKEFFKHGGTIYKAVSTYDERRDATSYSGEEDPRTGKVK